MEDTKVSFAIVDNFIYQGFPALVGNVGVLGHYYVTYSPSADLFEVGYIDLNRTNHEIQRFSDTNMSVSLFREDNGDKGRIYDFLKERFLVNVANNIILQTYEETINRILAKETEFDFHASNPGLSGNASLTAYDGNIEFYMVFDDCYDLGKGGEFAYVVGSNNIESGQPDENEKSFETFEEAEKDMIDRFGIKIQNGREKYNFVDFAKAIIRASKKN